MGKNNIYARHIFLRDVPICLYYHRNTENAYGILDSIDTQNVEPHFRQKEQINALFNKSIKT